MAASWRVALNWRNYFRTQRLDIGETNTRKLATVIYYAITKN